MQLSRRLALAAALVAIAPMAVAARAPKAA